MVQRKFTFHSRFLILLISLLIQSLGIFPLLALDKAYPDQKWMNYKSSSFSNIQETIKDFLPAENEKANLFENILFVKEKIYSISYLDSKIFITILNINDKSIRKIEWTSNKPNGWAYSSLDQKIYIRSRGKISRINPDDFKLEETMALEDSFSNWHDMVIVKGIIYSLEGLNFSSYDLKTGKILSTNPLPITKVQKLIPWNENEVLLASTYWGNQFTVYNFNKNKLGSKIPAQIHHHSLMKSYPISDKELIVFDTINKKYEVLVMFGGSFVPISLGIEMLDNGKAIRFSPNTNTIEYKISLQANKFLTSIPISIALPPINNYLQTIESEEFPQGKNIQFDTEGNRVLKITIQELAENSNTEITVYKAKWTRYKVVFDLSHLNQKVSSLTIPEELIPYTEDSKYLNYHHPTVQSKKESLIPNESTIIDTVTNVQIYSASIPYKSGNFNSAPIAMTRNNGGCTEHSYITMALLRSSGIPARLVWNHLPSESETSIDLNHKFVEAWLPDLGWIPMEPLSSPRTKAGSIFSKPLIFANLKGVYHPQVTGGDRLTSLQAGFKGITSKDLKITYTISLESQSEMDEESNTKNRSRQYQSSGETLVN
jgi:hypothetical protein